MKRSNQKSFLFWLYFMYKYIFINDQQFGVSIYSRSSNGIGISIQTIFSNKSKGFSPNETLRTNPGEDSEKILNELGAFILDIQQMGDYGIQKWISHNN